MKAGTLDSLRNSSSLALVSAVVSWRNFLKRVIILTMKENVLLRRPTMPAIWESLATLTILRTLGFRRIGISSLAAMLIRSEAKRFF